MWYPFFKKKNYHHVKFTKAKNSSVVAHLKVGPGEAEKN